MFRGPNQAGKAHRMTPTDEQGTMERETVRGPAAGHCPTTVLDSCALGVFHLSLLAWNTPDTSVTLVSVAVLYVVSPNRIHASVHAGIRSASSTSFCFKQCVVDLAFFMRIVFFLVQYLKKHELPIYIYIYTSMLIISMHI
jgi:hypothetical protein